MRLAGWSQITAHCRVNYKMGQMRLTLINSPHKVNFAVRLRINFYEGCKRIMAQQFAHHVDQVVMPYQSAENLIWLDLEMTGLDINTCHIIEIASIVTDKNLNVMAIGPELAIHQPQMYLDQMDDWCTKTHGDSGLTQRVKDSSISLKAAEALTLAFVQKWTLPNASPLCGNSIGTDRKFIEKYMPEFNAHLHYRNIDVSSLKELIARWYPDLPKFPKQSTHLALDDIKESIAECLYYKVQCFKEKCKA